MKGKKRILVVEDSFDHFCFNNPEQAVDMLNRNEDWNPVRAWMSSRSEEVDVDIASTYQQAIELLDSERYDWVICDISVPYSRSIKVERDEEGVVEYSVKVKFFSEETDRLIHELRDGADMLALDKAMRLDRWPVQTPYSGGENVHSLCQRYEETTNGQNLRYCGLPVAARCKSDGIPFTVYTHDWGHSNGAIPLVAASLCDASDMNLTLRRHLTCMLTRQEDQGHLFISRTLSFAVGFKFEDWNWEELLNAVLAKLQEA